ncbi:hypothetical protein I551_2381 [Mycobacterium ulcerans str. Harvey]|uniref:Uncharacterized protein n=1 Tax=Mycobacterium ulcerans str. Harvey TaxID=1299332 RepID=A0ABP3AIT9_MYCUL|nr:hypothetical protein I551_2381 [Mycobacterium ulcerans str. Harvey]
MGNRGCSQSDHRTMLDGNPDVRICAGNDSTTCVSRGRWGSRWGWPVA